MTQRDEKILLAISLVMAAIGLSLLATFLVMAYKAV